MDYVDKIKNARKISVSPWANEEHMAERIGKGRVFSNKPNPAFLAFDNFDESLIRGSLLKTKKLCEKTGCPLEFILKDISTVRNKPQNLWKWAQIAREVAVS
jgi:hypothetical protein